MNERIDPVREASAYQRMLSDLVGEDDPLEVQEATPRLLRELIAEAADRLRVPPAEGEWSVIEVVGHIADAEIVYAARYRWILAHDEPPLEGYDQDRWVERQRHRDADPEAVLAPFEALRRANLDLWRRTSPEERARVGIHRERGPESLELSFRLIAGHDRFHLAQARRTLEAVQR